MRLNVITGYCDSKYFCLALHFCNDCSNRYVSCQNIDTYKQGILGDKEPVSHDRLYIYDVNLGSRYGNLMINYN